MLQPLNQDISTQINRILSSKIPFDLFGSFYAKQITSPSPSPIINKMSSSYSMSSPPENIQKPQRKSKKSQTDKIFEQNLYEKAEQIFKLHSMLENQISNINELVKDNQLLENQNKKLNLRLKQAQQRLKQRQFEQNTQAYQEKIYKLREQITRLTLDLNSPKHKQKNKNQQQSLPVPIQQKRVLAITHLFQLTLNPYPLSSTNNQHIFPKQSQLNKIINKLQERIQLLNNDNSKLKQSLNLIHQSAQCNSQVLLNINKMKNLQQLDYYQSVFLKSQTNQMVQTQKIQQNLRQLIFNLSQSKGNSFFNLLLHPIKYRGEMIKGLKTGLGTQEYFDCFRYEGYFNDNQKQGLGRLFYQDKLVYEGEWSKNKFQGKGTIYISLDIEIKKIEGNFKDGMLNGFALITFKSGSKSRVRFRKNVLLTDSNQAYKLKQHLNK